MLVLTLLEDVRCMSDDEWVGPADEFDILPVVVVLREHDPHGLQPRTLLSLLFTAVQGVNGVSVWKNIVSLAAVYSSHRSRDARSIGECFHCRTGSIWRMRRRVRCSAGDTENQNFVNEIPGIGEQPLQIGRPAQEQRVLLVGAEP